MAGDESGCVVGDECEVVSDVVNVGNGTANSSSSSSSASVVTVTVPIEPPQQGGNGTCGGGLLDELKGLDAEETCQAGCCVDGGCECIDGYYGARCELELRCGASVDGLSWDFDACASIELPDERRATCSCSGLGLIAVLSHRLRPTSALLDAIRGTDWPRDLADELGRHLGLAVLLPLLLYTLLMGVAHAVDRRTLYTTEVPAWAVPGAVGFPFWRQLAYTARTQHLLLRLWHVVPGRTGYSRAQLVHVLATATTLNCVGAVLFLQAQQCSTLAALVAGAISGLVSSGLSVTVRLAFLHARDARTRRHYCKLAIEREQLFAFAALASMQEKSMQKKSPPSPALRTWHDGPARSEAGVDMMASPRGAALIGGLEPPSRKTAGGRNSRTSRSSSSRESSSRGTRRGTEQRGSAAAAAQPQPATSDPSFVESPRLGGQVAPSTGVPPLQSLAENGGGPAEGAPPTGAEPAALATSATDVSPAQLCLLSDGIGIGLRLNDGDESCGSCVAAIRVGAPLRLVGRRSCLRVHYDATAPAAHAPEDAWTPVVSGGPASLVSLPSSPVLRQQLSKRLSSGKLGSRGDGEKLRSGRAAPPLSPCGCSLRLGLTWGVGAAFLAAGWFLVLLIMLVAAPRSCEQHGISMGEWRRRAAVAAASSLLMSCVCLESLKIFVLVLTGPAHLPLLMRVRNPRLRAVLRQLVHSVHTPLGWLV